MTELVVVRWQGWSGESIEHLTLSESPKGIVAKSEIRVIGDDAYEAWYRIFCDELWRVKKAEVGLAGRKLELASDGAGNWSDGSNSLPGLRGAIDIDIVSTPFTNTLPIRRLDLRAGQSRDILAAYVWLPELAVTVERQRYTRIDESHYRFESGDFMRDIEVDSHGLIVTYPGLFKRV